MSTLGFCPDVREAAAWYAPRTPPRKASEHATHHRRYRPLDGRPEFDNTIMAEGFALDGVVMVLFALLLHVCRAATPLYSDRLKPVSLVAAFAASMINAGDIVWWAMPTNW